MHKLLEENLQPLAKEEAILLYNRGYELFNENRLEEARVYFQELVMALPLKKECWQALAIVLQKLALYEESIRACASWAILDPESYQPHYGAFVCYSALGNEKEKNAAFQCLPKSIQESICL